MNTKMTNLLAPSGIRRVRHGYLLRLLTIALLLGSFVVIVHALFLLPSHLHAAAEVRERSLERSQLADTAATPEEAAAQARIKVLEDDLARLRLLSERLPASKALEGILLVPREGVRLEGISYTAPASATSTRRMVLSGTAATRESLRIFTERLESVDGVDEVELPISAYAKESAIPFSLTLTGRFTI